MRDDHPEWTWSLKAIFVRQAVVAEVFFSQFLSCLMVLGTIRQVKEVWSVAEQILHLFVGLSLVVGRKVVGDFELT